MKILQICFIFIVIVSCFSICIQGISYSKTSDSVYNMNSLMSYPTIQEAIDNASSGDTIQVNSSTYQEQVVVNKQLTLIGEDTGEGQPIIDGNGGTGINITASGVTVHGFNVTNSTWGINVTSNNCIVSGNTVNNNTVIGINLEVSSYNNTISGNTANDNIYGIYLIGSDNNTISGNTAENNSNDGISLSTSNNNSLTGNTANYNGDIYNHGYGIYFYSSSNNTVTLNIASNNTIGGIRFDEDSSNNSVTGNTADNNSMMAGIELDYLANDNTIIENEADNNQLGFSLNNACNNSVSNNMANNNTLYGIYIFGTSDNNTISGNTANNNSDDGIILWLEPSNNTISGNTIDNNGYGINIYSSSNNVLWLNVFQDNRQNAYSDNSSNSWNSTTILSYVYDGQTFTNYTGNYWSNYTGKDADRDGIGETPYVINATTSDVDYYPMMVLPPAPIANFTSDTTSGNAPLTIQFNDTSIGSGISTWQWNFGDGTGNYAEHNLTHTFNDYGVYAVTLTVSNDGGSDTKQIIDYITVHNATPTANFTSNKTMGNAPLTVQFNDTSLGSGINAWQWNFSDGTGNFTDQNITHIFNNAGVYTVTLTVSNDGGYNTTIITNYITVLPTIPVASFTSNITSGNAPLTVQFNDTSSNTPTAWNWSFGDGNYSNGQNPVHTYTVAGNYNVLLNATNSGGSNTTTKINYITVNIGNESYTYNLIAGWNLISVPLDVPNNTIEGFFPANVSSQIWDLWGWDAPTQTWNYWSIDPASPYWHFNKTTNMEAGKAYWLNMNSNVSFTITGSIPAGAPNATVSLGPNWNMVGVTGLNPSTPQAMYPNGFDVWTYIPDKINWKYWSYDPTSPYWHYQNMTMIQPGEGVYVNV